jgi:hypothetical protein
MSEAEKEKIPVSAADQPSKKQKPNEGQDQEDPEAVQAALERKMMQGEKVERIRIKCRGTPIHTGRNTLTKHPDSKIARMFKTGSTEPPPQDSTGYFLLDRDFEAFTYVINYLRDNEADAPREKELREQFLREAEYWELPGLVAILQGDSAVALQNLACDGKQQPKTITPESFNPKNAFTIQVTVNVTKKPTKTNKFATIFHTGNEHNFVPSLFLTPDLNVVACIGNETDNKGNYLPDSDQNITSQAQLQLKKDHNIALVFDTPRKLASLYIDGVADTKDKPLPDKIEFPVNTMHVGNTEALKKPAPLTGTISNLKIVRRALSASEVSAS